MSNLMSEYAEASSLSKCEVGGDKDFIQPCARAVTRSQASETGVMASGLLTPQSRDTGHWIRSPSENDSVWHTIHKIPIYKRDRQ